ncbi:helix-turn-helix domain-containing protein [Listeria kieliensis]
METLGDRLKKARQSSNMTQQFVSSKLGVSIGTLSGYERNYRDPDTTTLAKLAQLYNVSADYLLGNEEFDSSDVVAAHMDDDLTDEQKEEIYRYIEAIKIRDKNNEK